MCACILCVHSLCCLQICIGAIYFYETETIFGRREGGGITYYFKQNKTGKFIHYYRMNLSDYIRFRILMRDASKHKYSGGNYFIGKKIRLGWYTKDRNLKKRTQECITIGIYKSRTERLNRNLLKNNNSTRKSFRNRCLIRCVYTFQLSTCNTYFNDITQSH